MGQRVSAEPADLTILIPAAAAGPQLPRRDPGRPLCLAARRELARGHARPRRARSRHPRLSRHGECRSGRLVRPAGGAQAHAGRRDARAHQGGRFHRPGPGRAVRLLHALPRGRPASADLPPAGGRYRAPTPCCSTATRWREGKAFFQFGDASHAPDHARLAWSADEAGSEYFTLRVRDLATGRDLPDLVSETTGDILWGADSRHLYYVRRDAEHRPSFVYRHVVGTDPSSDVLIYEEPDKGFFVSLGRTQSGRFGLISCGDHDTSEVYLIDLADPASAPLLVEPRSAGLRYGVEHHPRLEGVESLIIETNADERRGLQDRRRPAQRAGPGELARDRAAPPGPADPRRHRAARLSAAAGARGRLAAHRGAHAWRRRRARHRLCRGSLFARFRSRLWISTRR